MMFRVNIVVLRFNNRSYERDQYGMLKTFQRSPIGFVKSRFNIITTLEVSVSKIEQTILNGNSLKL